MRPLSMATVCSGKTTPARTSTMLTSVITTVSSSDQFCERTGRAKTSTKQRKRKRLRPGRCAIVPILSAASRRIQGKGWSWRTKVNLRALTDLGKTKASWVRAAEPDGKNRGARNGKSRGWRLRCFLVRPTESQAWRECARMRGDLPVLPRQCSAGSGDGRPDRRRKEPLPRRARVPSEGGPDKRRGSEDGNRQVRAVRNYL